MKKFLVGVVLFLTASVSAEFEGFDCTPVVEGKESTMACEAVDSQAKSDESTYVDQIRISFGKAFAQYVRIPGDVEAPPPVSGEVGWTIIIDDVDENATTLLLETTRTDPVGICNLLINTANGSATAGTDYTAIVAGEIQYGSGEGGTKTIALTVTNQPGVLQGFLDLTATITKDGANCASDTLTNTVITVTINDLDSTFPTGWTQPPTTFDGGVLTFAQSWVFDGINTWDSTNSDGGEISNTADHFIGPVFNIASHTDFTAKVCVTALAPQTGASFPLGGIMVREPSAANSPFVYSKGLGPDGGQGYDYSTRATAGASVTTGGQGPAALTLPDAFKIEGDGALESIKTFHATDCATPSWTETGSFTYSWAGTGDNLWLVLAATATDDAEQGFSGVFTITGADGCVFGTDCVDVVTPVDHSAATTVDVNPTSVGVNEDVVGGTYDITVQRAGGLSGASVVDLDVTGGTCLDTVHYTDPGTLQVSWINGEGGPKSASITVIDIALEQQSCTIITTATVNSGTDTLGADTHTATWQDNDGTPPGDPGAWSTQGSSGCSDGNGSFDAFVPGMRGFGSCNRGGFVPGTTVISVTTRSGSGAGSFQAAYTSTACPKVIIFDVGGFFDYRTSLSAPMRAGSNSPRCNNWSIAGASAPGNVVIAGRDSSVHGGYGLAAVLQTRGSNWTIDHMTFTGGGSNDAIDLGSNTGDSGDNTNGILMNSNLIWGGDEIVQNNTDWSHSQHNTLMWQNYIGQGCCGFSGMIILQNTARNHGGIRNYLNDGFGRAALMRGDGSLWANNLIVNVNSDGARLNPCTGSIANPIDNTVRMNVINNVYASGGQGDTSFPSQDIVTHAGDTGSCTNFSLFEDGNRWRRQSGSLENCANHGCVQSGGWSGDFVGSIISAVYPTGYVPETIANTQAGIEGFANQVFAFAGQRPNDRIPFIQTRMEYGINSVDGAGTTSNYVRNIPPDGTPTIIADSSNGGGGGGYAVVTEANSSWDASAQGSGYFSGGMPTGAAADVIEASGYTTLHEWYICTHMDNVMPSGWRPDLLTRCTAP